MSTEHTHHHASPHGLVAAIAGALARGEGDGLPMLLHLASSELDAAQVAVFARDPDRDDLTLAGSVGIGSTTPDEATLATAARGETTLGRATWDDGVEGTVADLPLVVARGAIEVGLGVLTVRWAGRRALGEDDAAVLAAFADLVAVALDRSRLATLAESRADRAEQLAMIDGLTGLANGRTLDRVLELEVERAKRGGVVSVEIFDIDGFAALNERAGRDAGDDALREVAAALAGSVRLVDTVARTGADEFIVVAPGSAGRTVAERIVEALGSLPAGSPGRVTVSAGIARFPEDGEEADQLMAAARAALGAARAAGGGRIVGGDGAASA